jgi:predicted Zn-dependent protease
VWVGGIETGERELEDRHFEKAEACFQLMSQVNDDPWPVLLLADTHAAEGKRKQAIRDLDEAVKRGLNDAEVIESDAKLQSLKQEAEFQTLLQKLKHK